jgi:Flp pilus assembly CpaF family ATPase
MLQAMNTGHEGSMTTTHANSPREAVARMETLCMMAGLDLPVRAVRHQIATSIHLIVQQCRFADGRRRVTHISEVVGLDDRDEVELADLFRYEARAQAPDVFRATGHLPSFAEQLAATQQGEDES